MSCDAVSHGRSHRVGWRISYICAVLLAISTALQVVAIKYDLTAARAGHADVIVVLGLRFGTQCGRS